MKIKRVNEMMDPDQYKLYYDLYNKIEDKLKDTDYKVDEYNDGFLHIYTGDKESGDYTTYVEVYIREGWKGLISQLKDMSKDDPDYMFLYKKISNIDNLKGIYEFGDTIEDLSQTWYMSSRQNYLRALDEGDTRNIGGLGNGYGEVMEVNEAEGWYIIKYYYNDKPTPGPIYLPIGGKF